MKLTGQKLISRGNYSSKVRYTLLLLLLLLLLIFILNNVHIIPYHVSEARAAAGQDWTTYSSESFTLFFPESHRQQAHKLLYYLEDYKEKLEQLTGGKVEDRIYLNLEDTGLLANGFADPINERMGIFTGNPGTRSNLAGYESWLRLVGVHELTHILHLTKTSGCSDLTTTIFGNALAPNLHSPLWLIEGIAVYAESQSSPAEGRLNSGYYDGILAWRAGGEGIPELPEITYNHFHFPVGHRYLYGSTFMRYLAQEYGEKSFAEFFEEYGSYCLSSAPGNLFPIIGLDRAAAKIYGSSIEKLYDEWRQEQRDISGDWQIQGEVIYSAAETELSKLQSFDGKLYYLQSRRYPSAPFSYHRINRLKRYDPVQDEHEELFKTAAGISGSIQIIGDKIYFLQEQIDKGYANISRSGEGFRTELIEYDWKRDSKRSLVQAEIRDFLVLQDGYKVIYASDSKNGYGSKLFQVDEQGDKVRLGQISYKIGEMQYCEESDRMLVVAKAPQSSWGIYELNLQGFDNKPVLTPIVNSFKPEMHLFISDSGEKIAFTSVNDDGFRGIQGYDQQEGIRYKLTGSGYYGEEGVILDGHLYYLTFAEQGEALVRKPLPEKRELLEVYPEQIGEPENDEYIRENLKEEIAELELEEDSFWPQNLAGLFPPSLRLPPFLIAGQDNAGLNTYWFNLNPQGQIDFTLTSQIWQPLNLRFSSQGRKEERLNRLTASYPLYRSSPDGLTQIVLTAGTDFKNLEIGGSLRWRYPEHIFGLDLQSELLAGGFKGQLNYSYLRDRGRFSIGGSYVSGIDLPNKLRVPALSKTTNEGYHISAEYNERLVAINQGRWNPNIFIGGLYGGIFADYISQTSGNDNDESQLSGGLELKLETGLANAIHPIPRLGLTISRDSWQPFFGLEITF